MKMRWIFKNHSKEKNKEFDHHFQGSRHEDQ